jgi:YesN/AraC family two-component response regulator
MKNNVLFVDDEIHVLKAIKRGLYNETFNKFFASSGDEALEIMAKEEIHVIVTDMKMPKMTGLDLLTIVKDEYPDIVKVILSGYTQLQQILVTINRIDIYKFLTKPFDIENEFKQVIYSAIELYNTRKENMVLKESLAKKNEIYQKMIKTNSEKIDHVHIDFKFVAAYAQMASEYNYLLALKYKNGFITDIKYKEEVTYLEDLFMKTVKKMPSTYRAFEANSIKREIRSLLNKNAGYNYTLNINNAVEPHEYYGNFNIVIFTLYKLLMDYYVMEPNIKFNLAISERVYENENKDLLFLLKTSNNMIISDLLRIRSLKTFFVCLFEAFNGYFSFELIENGHLVMLRIPITYKSDEGD